MTMLSKRVSAVLLGAIYGALGALAIANIMGVTNDTTKAMLTFTLVLIGIFVADSLTALAD